MSDIISKFKSEQRVQGNSILKMGCLGVIKDIIPPQAGQRCFIYQVKRDDNSQSEENERNLWASSSRPLEASDDEIDKDEEAADDEDDEEDYPEPQEDMGVDEEDVVDVPNVP